MWLSPKEQETIHKHPRKPSNAEWVLFASWAKSSWHLWYDEVLTRQEGKKIHMREWVWWTSISFKHYQSITFTKILHSSQPWSQASHSQMHWAHTCSKPKWPLRIAPTSSLTPCTKTWMNPSCHCISRDNSSHAPPHHSALHGPKWHPRATPHMTI